MKAFDSTVSSPPQTPTGQRRTYFTVCFLLVLTVAFFPSKIIQSVEQKELKKETNTTGTPGVGNSSVAVVQDDPVISVTADAATSNSPDATSATAQEAAVPVATVADRPKAHAAQDADTGASPAATPNFPDATSATPDETAIAEQTTEEAPATEAPKAATLSDTRAPVIPGSISMVTSLWAQPPEQEVSPHRREIEASLLNNMNNPHLHQIVIILDGSNVNASCAHFKARMEQVEADYNKFGGTDTSSPEYQNRLKPILTCVDRTLGQPNYFDMFSYAADPTIVTGDVVILENADHAFDHTVQYAGQIKDNVIMTLSSWGFDASKENIPSPTKEHMQFIHGWDLDGMVGDLRRRCKWASKSWDGYVFHRKIMQGRLDPSLFQRNNVFFLMNQYRAEWAALAALKSNFPEASFSNGCTVIQTWHMHGFPKMHGNSSTVMEPFDMGSGPDYGAYLEPVPFKKHIWRLIKK
ncbi:expressed unknown protein [Seminavis robusta]|uniref:Uncharacterized protein n=1 Tax=Seminavis robusta TaxID=568900 RepID=A0A9N8DEK7_9STRA|nr:expressed unknown protein [Seminavis robusta]|eukprot:Sro82_g043800.1 n/a (468) ;mRNA; f:41309-42712